MRDEDYLIGTYRTHGHAIARGTDPKRVMAELFGRVDGTSGGRGGSMHIFDAEQRFMGGYGIVGGNLPLAAGLALSSDYKGTDEVTVCMFGDGASNTGNFGETMNLAALWRLPVVFILENNLYGMGTAVDRHSAVTDFSKKAEGLGVPGVRVDGMDVLAMRETVGEHIRLAREERTADPGRGVHLPLPGPLRRRPRGLPREGGGRGVAQEGPGRDVPRSAALAEGVISEERGRRDARARSSGSSPSRSSSPTPLRSRRSTASTTTSTSSATRSRAGTPSTSARPSRSRASASARSSPARRRSSPRRAPRTRGQAAASTGRRDQDPVADRDEGEAVEETPDELIEEDEEGETEGPW